MPNIEIIPRLHVLGSQIRSFHHIYEGYKNLIQRMLVPPDSAVTNANGSETPYSMSRSMSIAAHHPSIEKEAHVVISRSARARFERLSDRLQLLILSQTEEFLTEKDALMNTVSCLPFHFPFPFHIFPNTLVVLQHKRPKRLQSNSPPLPRRNTPRKTIRRLPPSRPNDLLLLSANSRPARRVHVQAVLVRLCSYHEYFHPGVVFL
jgi:hypothetical protein